MASQRKKQVISLLLILATLLGIFFATRFIAVSRRFGPPPNNQFVTDPELVRGWMSAEYISNAYQIPLPILIESLQLKPGQQHIPLRVLEHENPDESNPALLLQVQSTIREFQQHSPKPGEPAL